MEPRAEQPAVRLRAVRGTGGAGCGMESCGTAALCGAGFVAVRGPWTPIGALYARGARAQCAIRHGRPVATGRARRLTITCVAAEDGEKDKNIRSNQKAGAQGWGRLRWSAGALAAHFSAGVLFCTNILHWSWEDSLYFCVVTMTTVGYGDLVPTTPMAKVFVMVYTLFSLTIVASAVQTTFTALLERQEKSIQDFWENQQSSSGVVEPTSLGFLPEEIRKLATATGGLLFLIAAGTAFYAKTESMSTLDSLYMIWITCTTVGFGDVTPQTDVAKLFSVAFLFCATFSLANLLGTGTDVLMARRQREWQQEILQRKVDMSDLVSMDTDGDGRISKLEFLVAMLQRLETVPGEEINSILKRFDELDKDGSGHVEVSELET